MLIDISIPLGAQTPPWPGDVPYSCGWTCRREDGESINLGVLTHSPHVGTHADAPMHVESAWGASETLPAEWFVGECAVIALPEGFPCERDIDAAMLASLLGDAPPSRVLLRSGYSIANGTFPDDWPALSLDGVAWMHAHGVRVWGSDAPSADRRESKTLPVHHALFTGGAYVIENLRLDHVTPGRYELLAQPLAVHGADAAPLRALLRPLALR